MPSPFADLYVHLVWATRNREPLMNEAVRAEVWPALAAKCTDLECTCLAVGGIEDHVHVLVGYPPGLAVAQLVGQLKGNSSHMVNALGLTAVVFRWQASYGAFSISRRSVSRVADYVRDQAQHHLRRETIALLEQLGSD